MITSPLSDAALIEHIHEQFHAKHRRDLPTIIQLSRELELTGASPGMTQSLEAMAAGLELHMFKEEMRLFPMMEQGGNTLLWQLIDDMRAEHLAQRDEMARLTTRLSEWQVPEPGRMLLSQLRESVRGLFTDLDEHMQVEDDDLFRRFDTGRPLRRQDARRPRD